MLMKLNRLISKVTKEEITPRFNTVKMRSTELVNNAQTRLAEHAERRDIVTAIARNERHIVRLKTYIRVAGYTPGSERASKKIAFLEMEICMLIARLSQLTRQP